MARASAPLATSASPVRGGSSAAREHGDLLSCSVALPHPLHLFASLTGTRHYHLGLPQNGSGEGNGDGIGAHAADEPLARALDRLSERCIGWLPSGGSVLDVGCGMGGTLELLVRRGHDAVGVDPCAGALARAEAALRGAARLYRSGFLELDERLPDERFDGMILIEAIHRLPSLSAVLATARRRLRAHGVLVAQDVVLAGAEEVPGAPFHPRGALGRCAARHGFDVVHEEDLAARAAPTLGRLRDRLREERARLVARFRGSHGDVESQIAELDLQMQNLAEAFAARLLSYEEVVLRARPDGEA